ncbi:protein NDR1-like [Chenopodium quinoa]|uniref:protein NDR1-like n=1 Tax=Chenopodium quinoa TaxID=63459 RepID=UPI000B789991|nr:protein NDR1-like [Chenopodium quinoa]
MAAQKKFSKGGGCCGVITTVAISAILFWFLIIRTSKPVCSIEEFDIFSLTNSTNNVIHHNNTSHYNNTISYDLKLNNKNHNKGIFYDAVDVTFYYKSKSYSIRNDTFPPFYQGRLKSTHRYGKFDVRGVKWENETAPVMFKVELKTAVRFKNTIWKTHRHQVVVEADLKVNSEGSLIKGKGNKGIVLRSKAEKNKGRYELVGILGILIFIIYSW